MTKRAKYGTSNGYSAVHCWLKWHFGNPLKCENCGVNGKKLGSRRRKWSIEHALRPGLEHGKFIERYRALCMSCHRRQDYETSESMQHNFKKGWISRKKKHGLNKIGKDGRFIKNRGTSC